MRKPLAWRSRKGGRDVVRSTYVDLLQKSYHRYYNILPAPDPARPDLVCRCDLDMKQAQYVLSKKNELWSADSHEHCYIFSERDLTEDRYRDLEAYVYEEGMKLIHPGRGHMSTALTLLIVCDSCSGEAERLLKRCRIHKSFRFSLDGWMDFRTALVVLSPQPGRAVTNMSGHENAKILRQLLGQKRGTFFR